MARPDDKEEEKIVKPATGKRGLVPEEDDHQNEANDQSKEWGVEEPTVAERMMMRKSKIEQKQICIGQNGGGDSDGPETAGSAIRGKSDAYSGSGCSVGDNRGHI